MRVILIAIGMHTKPCIASPAFTVCYSTDLIFLQNKALVPKT